jgi:hypothetical protein
MQTGILQTILAEYDWLFQLDQQIYAKVDSA